MRSCPIASRSPICVSCLEARRTSLRARFAENLRAQQKVARAINLILAELGENDTLMMLTAAQVEIMKMVGLFDRTTIANLAIYAMNQIDYLAALDNLKPAQRILIEETKRVEREIEVVTRDLADLRAHLGTPYYRIITTSDERVSPAIFDA